MLQSVTKLCIAIVAPHGNNPREIRKARVSVSVRVRVRVRGSVTIMVTLIETVTVTVTALAQMVLHVPKGSSLG